MCRLFAIASREPVSPMVAMEALNVMREGHDGSGVGLFLRDLAGPFEEIKDAPILSGIFSEGGLKRLDSFMMDVGFMTKYKISIKVPKTPPPGIPRRDIYLIRAYEDPVAAAHHGRRAGGYDRFFVLAGCHYDQGNR
jgi:hypothetical protein